MVQVRAPRLDPAGQDSDREPVLESDTGSGQHLQDLTVRGEGTSASCEHASRKSSQKGKESCCTAASQKPRKYCAGPGTILPLFCRRSEDVRLWVRAKDFILDMGVARSSWMLVHHI